MTVNKNKCSISTTSNNNFSMYFH